MRTKWFWALVVVGLLTALVVVNATAVSGAAYTTFNAHVDGASKDVCKNSAINCNIYGAKQYVWLNGGPSANGLGPDGQYFFAVLAPGGQPDPNDNGAKNLSDDYDTYLNRVFNVTNGEVSAYTGNPGETKHWLDDGKSGPKPNWKPPYIRLFPYADTPNPGGVYIMAICYIGQDGQDYPVDPRECKYDAFKVKKGKYPISFMLSGIKFQDTYATGAKDSTAVDPGLPGWTITIKGTGPDGSLIDKSTVTGPGGYWEWMSDTYTFPNGTLPGPVHLVVCEDLTLQPGWNQSYPDGGSEEPYPSANGCWILDFTPVGFDSFENLDFGNWQPVDVTGCKNQDRDGDIVPVEGWMITLTKDGEVVEAQPTGSDGCYTWTDLRPGPSYDLHEEEKAGWEALGPVDVVFDRAGSGDTFSHTFVNMALEGCTPGFWQGGSDGGQAGGQWLWNEVDDPDWVASGGAGFNPYTWTTEFNSFFTSYSGLSGLSMMDLVGTGGGSLDYQKAARDLVAAYLNSSWGMGYPYTTTELSQMWADAVTSGDFMSLHLELDAANNAYGRTDGGPACPISASGY